MRLLRLLGFCLALLLAAGNSYAQDTLRYAGATTLQRFFMPEAARLFNEETGFRIQIAGGNTDPGISALLKGQVDMAGAGRHLTAEEKAQGLVEHFLGWDVLAIVLHQTNPVEDLSLAQLQGIFAGRITNWKQVGGADQQIIVVTSPKGAGMRQSVQNLILKQDAYLKQEVVSAIVAESDQQLSLFPMGITALSRSMVDNPDIKMIKVNGVLPTPENLANKRYPLAKTLALVTKGKPKGTLARFIDLALDSRGRTILKKYFVPRTP